MYVPAPFSVPDTEELHALINAHPLGVLVANTPNGLDANHIPFELDAKEGEHGMLRAHVARSNPIWQDIKDGDEVLVVFRGEEAYVTPNWFPSKHEFHRQVPTWNYKVVHLHGKIRIRDDERFVRGMVARLTRTHEASQPTPWKMTDAPAEYIDTMLKAILGMEIEVTKITGKFKLSQNRELRDRLSLGAALIAQGEIALGQATLDAIKEEQS
ncbi:FMN-binding negative transcriptional regulator [Paraburkholderia hospita]|uniref:FMN-binding negative transcriptional regulator n=1 Tax=Paraburkholderia hospita TaxID=169430 RepID=UPI000DEF38C5|nr:FMN-binding negative transcriptional regulator [Paraburkholderia hospita]AXF05893.1 transcriptional regulator [Paraburkholderia hospita]